METEITQAEINNCVGFLNAINRLLPPSPEYGLLQTKDLLAWANIHNSHISLFQEALGFEYFLDKGSKEGIKYTSFIETFEPIHARKCIEGARRHLYDDLGNRKNNVEMKETKTLTKTHSPNKTIEAQFRQLKEENLYLRYKDTEYDLDPLIYSTRCGDFFTGEISGTGLGEGEFYVCKQMCPIDAILFIEFIKQKHKQNILTRTEITMEFKMFIGRKWEMLKDMNKRGDYSAVFEVTNEHDNA